MEKPVPRLHPRCKPGSVRPMGRTAKIARQFAEAVAPLVDLAYPPRCPLCGDGIAAQRSLCTACWGELVIPGQPSCASCQRPFGTIGAGEGAICAPCLGDPPAHDGIAAGTLYNDASRKLILSFKHGGRIALAPMLAQLIGARLPEVDGDWLAVPVPLHRWRLWRRGYNQAAMLASELAKSTGVRVLRSGLLRTRPTPSLGGLGKGARRKALSGALTVNPKLRSQIEGRDVILVDDVLTSGATSNACVNALKQAGARRVVIACFARVLDEAVADPGDANGMLAGQTETPGVMQTPGAP